EVAEANVTGTFDGTRLTITWIPTPGFVEKLDTVAPRPAGTTAPGSTAPTQPRSPAKGPQTLVYEHSADLEFDRLKLSSGSELPNGIQAPKEMRRLKPPQVIFPAEWEQSEEILWSYGDAYAAATIYKAALKGCAANGETVKHRFYVASGADERQLRWELAEGLSAAARKVILYRRAPIQTVWIRDFGPWTVRKKKDDKRAIGDLGYYADRVDDDRMPVDYAKLRGWERLDLSSLKIEGGNIMSDGKGKVYLTGRVLEGTGRAANDSQEAVESTLRQVGASEVHFVERMAEPEGTGHIDMFAKLMDENTVLVGRHHDARWAAGLERNAARFASLGLRVVRVDFARPERTKGVGAEGLGLMTYTNSLFVGKTVLVTAYKDKERDSQALDVYRGLGWKPVGVDVRAIIAQNGAIHCMSMQVPAR
ncbi:MAG: agmatine deiminase family protein, partial [Planctomycetota bacterium]